VKSRVATFYATGERIWYRQVVHANQVAGVVEDITVDSPTVMAFAWKTKIAFGRISLNSCRATAIRKNL
jgi:hypothetical protein